MIPSPATRHHIEHPMGKSDVKSFVTAGKFKASDDDERKVLATYELDDADLGKRQLTAYRPKDATLAYFAMAEDGMDQIGEVIRFLDAVHGPKDRRYISNRLRDPDDTFDLDDVTKIFAFLSGKLTNRPTE